VVGLAHGISSGLEAFAPPANTSVINTISTIDLNTLPFIVSPPSEMSVNVTLDIFGYRPVLDGARQAVYPPEPLPQAVGGLSANFGFVHWTPFL
jgi:hypothetical protein